MIGFDNNNFIRVRIAANQPFRPPFKEEEMPEQADIKKALETIMGHELSDEEVQLIDFFRRVATWDRTDLPGKGFLTRQFIFGQFKNCPELPLVDVSAFGTTDGGGTSVLRLTDFICLDGATFEQPVNVVATPRIAKPVFVTVEHSLVIPPGATVATDVEIRVFTWDDTGAPAGEIPFDWRCRVGFGRRG
jgi:hypothetical protein